MILLDLAPVLPIDYLFFSPVGLVIVGVILATVVTIVLIRRKRKKKQQTNETEDREEP